MGRSSNSRSSSFGFQKGFLLSSSKKTKNDEKKRTKTHVMADQQQQQRPVPSATTPCPDKHSTRLLTQSSELLHLEDVDPTNSSNNNHGDAIQDFLRKPGFLGNERSRREQQQRLNDDPQHQATTASSSSSTALHPFIIRDEKEDCDLYRRGQQQDCKTYGHGGSDSGFLLEEVSTTIFSAHGSNNNNQCSPTLTPSPPQRLVLETAHDSSSDNEENMLLSKMDVVTTKATTTRTRDTSNSIIKNKVTVNKTSDQHDDNNKDCDYAYWSDQLAVTLTLLKQLRRQRQRPVGKMQKSFQSSSSWRGVAESFVQNLMLKSQSSSSSFMSCSSCDKQQLKDQLEQQQQQQQGPVFKFVWESILSEWNMTNDDRTTCFSINTGRRQRHRRQFANKESASSLVLQVSLRQLSRVLMEHAPLSIIPFLSCNNMFKSEQNDKKHLALVAIAVLDYFILSDEDDEGETSLQYTKTSSSNRKGTRTTATFAVPWQQAMVSHIFPALVELISNTTTRTILAQRASDTALTIMALAAQHIVIKADSHINMTSKETTDNKAKASSATKLEPAAANAVNDSDINSNDDDDDDKSFWTLVHAICEQSSALEQLWTVHQGWLLSSSCCSPPTTNTTKTTAVMDIRCQCRRAVLEDWKQLLHHCRRHCNMASHAIPEWRSDNLCLLEWCRQLNGVVVPWHVIYTDDYVDNLKDHHPSSLVGGLQQTLSSSSSLLSSIYNGGSVVDGARHVLSILEVARELIAVDRNNNTDSSQHTEHSCHIRALLRAILAWLGQSSKHLDLLLQSNNNIDDKTVPLLTLIAEMLHAVDEQVVVLVLALLDMVWATRSAAVLDTARNSFSDDEILDCLLNAVKERGVEATRTKMIPLQPGTRAICDFLIRHIFRVRSDKCSPCALLSPVVSKLGISSSATVYILVISMTKADTFKDSADEDGASLPNFISDLFLEHFHDQDIIQEAMSDDSSIFVRCSTSHVIPNLIQELANLTHTSNENKLSRKLSALVTPLMGIILDSQKQNQDMNVVPLIVETLQQLAENKESQPIVDFDRAGGFPLDAVCATFAVKWRRALLTCCTDANAFAQVLCDLAAEMFKSPSSLVPLAMIGSLVDGEDHDMDSSPTFVESSAERLQICIAVVRTCEQCVDEFDRLLGKDDDSTSRENIFARLSPLLLLRRIPVSFFRITRQEAVSCCDSMDKSRIIRVFASLGDHIVRRLDENIAQQSFTDEERRLSAEVSGRVLPLGSLAPTNRTLLDCHSLFDRVCDPYFSILRKTLDSNDGDSTRGFRSARAALFAVCTLVASASASDNGGNELILIADFCLAILSTQNHGPAAELEKIQAGCIEFFSCCFERELYFAPGPPPATLQASSDASKCNRFDGGIRRVNEMIMNILTRSSSYQEDTSSIHICLWNALIIVSKRCRPDMLKRFAQATLPTILSWGTTVTTAVAVSLQYQLCLAGAMQVVFNVLVREKSIDLLVSMNHDTRSTLLQVHRWALSILRTTAVSKDSVGHDVMRKAALKLVLVVVSMGESSLRCLSPGELGETFSTLQGVARLDKDGELGMLATSVLQLLQVI